MNFRPFQDTMKLAILGKKLHFQLQFAITLLLATSDTGHKGMEVPLYLGIPSALVTVAVGSSARPGSGADTAFAPEVEGIQMAGGERASVTLGTGPADHMCVAEVARTAGAFDRVQG